MNERQEFALLNPINAARGALPEAYRRTRKDKSGLLLMSILAVDR